jgi:hypothetical protein
MSDIALPLPARSLWRVAQIAVILALALVVALALIRVEECRIVPGAFSSAFSLGFDVSRRVCDQSTLATVMVHKVTAAIR